MTCAKKDIYHNFGILYKFLLPAFKQAFVSAELYLLSMAVSFSSWSSSTWAALT